MNHPSQPELSTAILDLFPRQGEWRDGEYFALPGNRMVELVRGHVEVLAMHSLLHQFVARLIFLQMNAFVEQGRLGIVMSAPTRFRIAERHYREPDVLFVAQRNRHRQQEQFWEQIDLSVEIISPDDADRDTVDKRAEYAAAGVAEYWVVDPRDDSIQVLSLRDGLYHEDHPEMRHGIASSELLSGWQVDVARLFRDARSQSRC